MEEGLLIIRGEYATIERELQRLERAWRREVKGLSLSALCLARNAACSANCDDLESERERLGKMIGLCAEIKRLRDRKNELARQTGWDDEENHD